ncbi:hypothetical protein AAZX31_01G019600 [Glycine max]
MLLTRDGSHETYCLCLRSGGTKAMCDCINTW